MHLIELEKKLPLFFSTAHIERLLGIQKASARVFCSRYLKKKIFTRVKRDLYILNKNQDQLSPKDLFDLSGKIQEPSYISFMSALAYYRLTSINPGFIEAVNTMRTSDSRFKSNYFKYHKFPEELFFGFRTVDRRFKIAEPEKALLDLLYMTTLGRYFANLRTINLENLSYRRLLHYSKRYPKRTQVLLLRLFKRASQRK